MVKSTVKRPTKAGAKGAAMPPVSAKKVSVKASKPTRAKAPVSKVAAKKPPKSQPAKPTAAAKGKPKSKAPAALPPKKAAVAQPAVKARVASAATAITSPRKALKPTSSDPARPDRSTNGFHQGTTMSKKSGADISSIKLQDGYRPADDEPFMGPKHRAYFRLKLMKWKDDIIKETQETLQVLHDDTIQHPDLADRATHESERAQELRVRDRQRKLIAKIDAALRRIEDGSYGYCEETGEPIALKRLDARPIATLSLEAQERHERRERVYRDE